MVEERVGEAGASSVPTTEGVAVALLVMEGVAVVLLVNDGVGLDEAETGEPTGVMLTLCDAEAEAVTEDDDVIELEGKVPFEGDGVTDLVTLIEAVLLGVTEPDRDLLGEAETVGVTLGDDPLDTDEVCDDEIVDDIDGEADGDDEADGEPVLLGDVPKESDGVGECDNEGEPEVAEVSDSVGDLLGVAETVGEALGLAAGKHAEADQVKLALHKQPARPTSPEGR